MLWHLTVSFAKAAASALLVLLSTTALAQVNIWTQHNNNTRTGANLAEVQLNTGNVNASQFGKLFQYSIDAAVFAQPLVISNLSIPGKGVRNVVFVATMNNSVYAFDADNPTTDSYQPIWKVSFNNPGAGITTIPSSEVMPNTAYVGPYGIMGSPVIDQATGTMYLLVRTKESGAYVQRLRALDITTGQQRSGSGIAIVASVTKQGVTTVFDPKLESQRTALALANGRVYIAWASHGDRTPYQGWIIAYNATTLQQEAAFNVATTNGQAGIWQSGQGPSIDSSGNLSVVTANGTYDGVSNFAQSVLKLSPSLALLDWFTPDNNLTTSNADLDLGSTGLLLIPGTPYGVTGSKEGRFYVVNTTNLGHVVAGNTQIPQLFQVSGGAHIHGSPVYWNGPSGPRVYVWPEQDYLKAFAFGGSSFNTTPVTKSTFTAPAGGDGNPYSMPGGFLSLSANGSAAGTGILWSSMPLSQNANEKVVPGVLRAFDAADLTKQLWNSQSDCNDQVGALAKYIPPTVANGKVYLVTFSNQLLVYGLRSAAPAANPRLVGSVRCDGSNVNLTTIGTSDWAKWPNYIHKATGGGQISNYTVLGSDAVQVWPSYARVIAWTDGTPTQSGSDQSGVYIVGNHDGFQVSAPADTTARTLYVYATGWDSAGVLIAHLSDGSAPDYVNALSGADKYDVVYTLTYKALSAGQRLIVSWTQTSDTGNVALRAAAMSGATAAPPPPTGVSASKGTSATMVTVSWSASAGATSYTVYRSTSSGALGSSIGTTNATSLIDSTPVPGKPYYYSVVAASAAGNSAPSSQAMGYAGTLATLQVSGTVSAGSAALSGVSFTASNGVTCTTSNASGAYTCTVPQGWSGTVTPTLSGYIFTPASRSYSNVTANQSAQDYAAVVSTDTVWVEDAVPAGAALVSSGGDTWSWVSGNPPPFSGSLAHQSVAVSSLHQHFFWNATATLTVGTGDTLFAYVYLDPANPPSEVMLQWNDGTWEHRAYWGANLINWGNDASASRRYMGALPALGRWVRLEVPAALVGLEGRTLNGMAFTLYNGRATWDRAGKTSGETVWMDDAVPAGAVLVISGGDAWSWVSNNPLPLSGSLAHQSVAASGTHQHYFWKTTATLTVGTGDTLFAYVYLDPTNPPSEVMLQWNDGTWEHRAYWGANLIPGWGINGTASLRNMGALPATGTWLRLEVPAALVGLEGRTLNGMAFTLYNGRATWDRAGKARH